MFLVVLMALSYQTGSAQHISYQNSPYFTNLRQEDGLPSSMINVVEEDEQGFMWIGTDNGLCRYDGYQTTIFKQSNKPGSLPNNNVRSLLLDDQILWVGTWKGLCTIDTKTFTITPVNLGENASVRSLYKSQDNRIWIGTSNGLIIYDKSLNKYEYFSSTNSNLSHSTIRCLYETQDSTMWIGTYNKLNCFKKGIITSYDLKGNYKPFLKNNLILDIKPVSATNDSILLVGTETGLASMNRFTKEVKLYNSTTSSMSNEVIKCIHHEENELWIGTDFGLMVLDSNYQNINTYYHNPVLNYSIANNVIWKIYKDRNNTLWLLTSNGISLLNNENPVFSIHEEFYSVNNQQAGNQIRDILVTNQTTYLATIHGIIAKKPNGQKTFFTANSNPNKKLLLNNAFALEQDPEGRIWIGTAGGINIWDSSTKKMHAINSDNSNGLTSNYISSFAITADGATWVNAWEGGIFKITGNTKTLENLRFIKVDNSATDKIYACNNNIYYISANQIWMVDSKNLSKTVVQPFNDELKNENILCMNTFEDKHLWLATNKRLIRYIPGEDKIESYTYNNPVINQPISIEKGNNNNIWMASISSVIKYNYQTGQIVSMPLNSSFPFKSFYPNCGTLSADGTIYFGGDNGYIESNSFEKKMTIQSPQAIISGISINNKYTNTLINNELLPQDISYLNEISLDHSSNSLSFYFSTLNYWQANRSQFRYKLEGFDSDWNNSSSTNFATYSNLKPGKYTLLLQSYNYAGIKSAETKKLTITILPPLWLSKPFLALYILLIIGLIYLTFKVFAARQRINNELRLANLEKQHSKEILKTKQQFFTNISHEFRTPLSLIMPPIRQVINSGTVNGKNLAMLQLAEKNSKRLLTLVNQILDFRKLETESIPLIKSNIELVQFCKDIFESFNDLAARHEIKYEFNTNKEACITSFDKEKIEAILFNILANAFKHTPVEGAIRLALNISLGTKNEIEITISDTGSGIPEEELNKIFDHFYQANIHRHQKQGTGIGLAMAREYATLHKGKIHVESTTGKGSTFTLVIPFEKADGIAVAPLQIHQPVNKPSIVHSPHLKKLLIVDDNQDILDYIEMNMVNEYQILRAENGQLAYQMIEKNMPDIIVSDIMMPVLDGIEFCKKVKANPNTQRIPVILLTAKSLDAQKTEGIESGANMYITKPFDIAYLKACINNLLSTETAIYEYIKKELIINPRPQRSSDNNQNEQFIKKVMKIISDNVSNPELSVEMISAEIGLSTTHLYRKIKAITNQSTKDVIKNYRLNLAAQMIQNNEGNVTEIMYNVGFSSLSSFSKSFKNMFGCNPSEYKNQKPD
ncbi:hybrid sensor histidine kinase/response regulator [Carboxylicivirga linearis]|uniref:histidine kinase n=1 Tax=Carboxylicivirga linearis TaxID=1628157 RepID=A0ABS5JUG0_9BACT|nr:two-component regulator propeller domain-containing protein [Carboxylicivirga linearis]MBS2098468.1 response regulator [Carboxylicivirga linearis]